jgi:hypothetical protein
MERSCAAGAPLGERGRAGDKPLNIREDFVKEPLAKRHGVRGQGSGVSGQVPVTSYEFLVGWASLPVLRFAVFGQSIGQVVREGRQEASKDGTFGAKLSNLKSSIMCIHHFS